MTRTAGGPVRALLLLLALLGLFAMHGLADHGAAGHHGGPGTTAAAEHHVSHEAPTSQPSAAVTEVVAMSVTAPLGDPGHTAGALCLAVLLLGLALLLAGRGTRLPRRATARLVGNSTPLPIRRPDPPDLTRLCVLRC